MIPFLYALYSRLRFAVTLMNDSFALRFYSVCHLFMEVEKIHEKSAPIFRALAALTEMVQVLMS